MKIYDISKELFTAAVYPGDPVPKKEKVKAIENGDICQLTELAMGSHTGTHMDAPMHFIPGGKSIAQVDLSKCVGPCKLVSAQGDLNSAMVKEWLSDGTVRLLIRGDITVTKEAAAEMVKLQLQCIGVEGMTVGPAKDPSEVHRILLGAETVIVENLNLGQVPVGRYFLSAAPLKMDGVDGSPVRALLVDMVQMGQQ